MTATATGAAVSGILASNDRTYSAHAVINEALIPADVTDLRRFETVPGQFIAGGLAATFILLAFAISQAAGALVGDTATQLKAMKGLLSIAGTKFVVSIAAIIVAIALVHRRTNLLIEAENALAGLANAIDAAVPLATETNEGLRLARQQVATLARLEDALGALAKPANGLAAALADAMVPVAGSINAMGDRIATTNAEALERMVKAFTSELGGATLRYNEALADILRETSDALRAAPEQLRAAAKATEVLLDAASDKTRLALEIAASAFTASADRLSAISDQAQRAEHALDAALVRANTSADAAAARLETLTLRIEAVAPGLAAAAAGAALAANNAASANVVLAETTATAAQMRDAMAENTRAWTVGMDDVDVKMAKILDSVRPFLPPDSPSGDPAPPPADSAAAAE